MDVVVAVAVAVAVAIDDCNQKWCIVMFSNKDQEKEETREGGRNEMK
jgi:hypothetical protein